MTIQHTPVYGIAYADTATALADLGTVTEQAADTIEAALAAGNITPSQSITDLINAGWFSDSGFVDITPKAGFAILNAAEKPQVRLRAGQLIFQGGFANTGMTAGGTFLVATLPAPYRPRQTAIVGLGSSSGDAVGSGFLTSAGDLSIRCSSVLGAYFKLDAFSGTLATTT